MVCRLGQPVQGRPAAGSCTVANIDIQRNDTIRAIEPISVVNQPYYTVLGCAEGWVAYSWRETYRGLLSDAVLDDPGLLEWREKFWTAALTDSRYKQNSVAVASQEDTLIGIAMSGPAADNAGDRQQLYVLYAYSAFHGSGVGEALLNAVIDPSARAVLWVADPNPRAQAFYRKNGFVADGLVKIEDDVRDIRMVRSVQADVAR